MEIAVRPALSALFLLLLSAGTAISAPKVMTSVMPVHSIVSAVMGETGQPELLLEGSMSEHRASFTPQQLAALGRADLVFIVGHGLEAKLAQLSGSDAVNGKRFVELAEAPGIRTLPVREGGAWEGHDDDHAADDGHGHGAAEGVLSFDPHVWLDPGNAKAMARAVAKELALADPDNAAAYEANAGSFATRLDELSAAIAEDLKPVRQKPYVVFHDAFQYFEERFGLSAVGSIADISASPPSAERLKAIRDKLAAAGALCVFREPQYDDKAVATVIEGSNARGGVLDPIGAGLEPGPDAYEKLLRNLASELAACLGA